LPGATTITRDANIANNIGCRACSVSHSIATGEHPLTETTA
jgi:hypothetical protein